MNRAVSTTILMENYCICCL